MKTSKPNLYLLISIFILGISSHLRGQEMNSFLTKQLEYSHSNENWFPPIAIAVEGLDASQASWKDESGNHSISQLVSHLVFWNERILMSMQEKQVPSFTEDNAVTFNKFTDQEWSELTIKLDEILSQIEEETQKLAQEKLEGWSETIANIASHNAYHTGQIVFIRKQKGWWR